MLRPLLPLLVLLAPCLPGAEETPAVRIAAELIHVRAAEQAAAGHGPVAGQLDALANALSAGQVSLADAALVVQIALAGQGVSGPATSAAKRAPAATVTADQVVGILDGKPPATAPASTPTPAPSPAPAPAPAADAPVVDAGPSTAPAPAPAAPAKAAGQVATVLAVGRAHDGKTSLVMISGGLDQHLVKGQALSVQRNGQKIATLSISDVRDTMAVCVELPMKGPIDAEIREGDAVFVE